MEKLLLLAAAIKELGDDLAKFSGNEGKIGEHLITAAVKMQDLLAEEQKRIEAQEKRLVTLANERERCIYWLCRGYDLSRQTDLVGLYAEDQQRHVDFQLGLLKALTDLGYDKDRVEQMLKLGEPNAAK